MRNKKWGPVFAKTGTIVKLKNNTRVIYQLVLYSLSMSYHILFFLLSGISCERFCLYCHSQRKVHAVVSWTWKVFCKKKKYMI